MPNLPRLEELQGCHRFLPDMVERISAEQPTGEAMLDGVAGKDDLPGFPGDRAGYLEVSESVVDRARPAKGHVPQLVCPRLYRRERVAVGNRDGQFGKARAILEAMEHGSQSEGQPRKSRHDGT